jgi:hypothetical protein
MCLLTRYLVMMISSIYPDIADLLHLKETGKNLLPEQKTGRDNGKDERLFVCCLFGVDLFRRYASLSAMSISMENMTPTVS